MIHGIKHRHSADEFQRKHLNKRQNEVQAPERHGGLSQLWSKARQRGPGQFSTSERHAATNDAREDEHAQHHDPHPAQPLRERAPKQETTRLGIDAIRRGAGNAIGAHRVRKNGSTGGREA